MFLRGFYLALATLTVAMAQTPPAPDLDAQRAAISKLSFLTGKWTGEARLLRASGDFAELIQTEEASFKLDGLLLVVEGVGRPKSGGKPMLQALGILSFDDATKTYRMRAFNDGRFLETEVKLIEEGKAITWGFTLNGMKTNTILRINDKGEWTEHGEITIGSQPPIKFLELAVRPQK